MRCAILSDIHANLPALERALEFCRRQGVDTYLCAGDLVGYGPFPNECVERVAELGALTVAGNHDLIVQNKLTTDRCIPLARLSLEWTQRVLRPDTLQHLAALPLRAESPGGIVMAHGALDDPQEYIRTPEQAQRELQKLQAEHPEAWLLILGHTHRPWRYQGGGGPLLLNPGSIGQSRDWLPRVHLALVDLDRRQITQHSLPYDAAQCRAALAKVGLSPRSCHLRPSPLGAGRAALRHLARLAKRPLAAARRLTS